MELLARRGGRPRRLSPTLRTPGAMAQPGIPAARGAAAGLQAQNGAASASGSAYTNGECCTGAGRTARPGPGRDLRAGAAQGSGRCLPEPGSGGGRAPAALRWRDCFICLYTFSPSTCKESVSGNCFTEVKVSGCHHAPCHLSPVSWRAGFTSGLQVRSAGSGVRVLFINLSL